MSRRVVFEFIEKRPIVKEFIEKTLFEYILEKSPAVNKYVKRISEVTGLPEEVVKRSKPVREYIKSLTGI
jgi:DNA mismatch repair ATPase MutS